MGFISKVELKRQLLEMGVKVEGNYVRKNEIKRFLISKVREVESMHEIQAAERNQLGVISAAVQELQGIFNLANGLLGDLEKLNDDVPIGKVKSDITKLLKVLLPFKK